MAKSVITNWGSTSEASKDFCGRKDIRTRREECRTWKCPEPPLQPTTLPTHKVDLLRYFDLTDDTTTDILRKVGGVTDAKGVRT